MPSLTWVLVLVVVLAGGEEKRTELAGPFTNLSACSIMGGIMNQRRFTIKIPEDAQRAYMACDGRAGY